MKRYTPLYRPAYAGRADFPKGWDYVEAPPDIAHNRRDIPMSKYRHGVIVFPRDLTADEVNLFELKEVD